MKYLVVTDNHLCEKSSVISGRGERFSDRLENQIESFKWVASFGLPVIHLGDFFNRSFLTAEEVSAFEEIRPYIKDDWMFLRGNHEYSGDYDVLGVLNSNYIRKPTEVDLAGLKTLFLPFNSTAEDIKGNYDIIFGHMGIKDIPFGAKGIDYGCIADRCKVFLNGHLHNRFKLGKLQWNIGSLTSQNFSDDCLQYRKGIVILDTDSLDLTFIENPHAFNFYKFSWSDWESGKFTKDLKDKICGSNSCLSVSCKEGKKKEIVSSRVFDEVYYLRISEEIKKAETDDKTIITGSLDYLNKFRTSFIDKYGESGIALEELAEVCK